MALIHLDAAWSISGGHCGKPVDHTGEKRQERHENNVTAKCNSMSQRGCVASKPILVGLSQNGYGRDCVIHNNVNIL